MKLLGDYHTHTVYSHGTSTVEENVIEAINKGLKTIGIAEHGPGHIFYGVNWENLRKMKKEIEELRIKYNGQIEILFGLEANIMDFNGHLDVSVEEAKEFDFLACGFHNGAIPKDFIGRVLYSPLKYIQKISKSFEKKIIDLATDTMIKATYNYDLKFLTHPGAKFYVDARRLANEMNPNTALEINNKHGYLDVEQLKSINDLSCKLIINSDAHSKSSVGNVDLAMKRLEESGISKDRVINIG